MTQAELLKSLMGRYQEQKVQFERFRQAVVLFFETEPSLFGETPPIVYNIRSRIKEEPHLQEKIERKLSEETIKIGKGELEESEKLSVENFFSKITDLAGVRVIHFHSKQIIKIHEAIMQHVHEKEWCLFEDPKAYTWDPETKKMMEDIGICTQFKESFYTSIHYVVMPKEGSIVKCEIQVRNLFEEIWGEIDHSINYPHKTKNISCKEQLKVLARLVTTGTRLTDSIFATFLEESPPPEHS